MATYEEMLYREIKHENLKKYDDGDDMTKFYAFKKIIDTYMENVKIIFLMNQYQTMNRLYCIIDDKITKINISSHIDKLVEDLSMLNINDT